MNACHETHDQPDVSGVLGGQSKERVENTTKKSQFEGGAHRIGGRQAPAKTSSEGEHHRSESDEAGQPRLRHDAEPRVMRVGDVLHFSGCGEVPDVRRGDIQATAQKRVCGKTVSCVDPDQYADGGLRVAKRFPKRARDDRRR
jgi:hypothetical protein